MIYNGFCGVVVKSEVVSIVLKIGFHPEECAACPQTIPTGTSIKELDTFCTSTWNEKANSKHRTCINKNVIRRFYCLTINDERQNFKN